MQLSKIRIKNYRLLIDAELEVDPKTTLIVGRNNTAKTSCFSCIGNVLEGNSISFNDYVVFVISKGWNQYQFETYAPMITGHATISKGKEGSYERNRNLFYVCCSRPKKRLFFFVTVPIETAFRAFLVTLVGEENILTYEQFMKMVH